MLTIIILQKYSKNAVTELTIALRSLGFTTISTFVNPGNTCIEAVQPVLNPCPVIAEYGQDVLPATVESIKPAVVSAVYENIKAMALLNSNPVLGYVMRHFVRVNHFPHIRANAVSPFEEACYLILQNISLLL